MTTVATITATRSSQRVETANVTLASLLARNVNGELIDLDMDLPTTIDLKALANGNQTTLPAGTLPAGDYDQLVVVMTQVELTFINGGAVSLTPPGGGWTSIVRVAPFTIVDGQDATIELAVPHGRSVPGPQWSDRVLPGLQWEAPGRTKKGKLEIGKVQK